MLCTLRFPVLSAQAPVFTLATLTVLSFPVSSAFSSDRCVVSVLIIATPDHHPAHLLGSKLQTLEKSVICH